MFRRGIIWSPDSKDKKGCGVVVIAMLGGVVAVGFGIFKVYMNLVA